MAYIIERNDHFYVVAYDGNDPRTERNDGVGIQPVEVERTPKQSPNGSALNDRELGNGLRRL